ncbi:MAG: epoxyqueuosine reductase QueH [Firmicutes bacterium]|nr:epoxyqueuosine reductase QueH [Bacillota bacterium]
MNYQLEMEKIIEKEQSNNRVPTLFLHSCCAPCSSYALEVLSKYFKITIFYYNPNIFPEEEYKKRVLEQQKFISLISSVNPISFLEGDYRPQDFFDTVRGYEHLKEGSERCFRCYRLRLEEAAMMAKKLGFDYFSTTLSISPYKNSQVLNEIGFSLEEKYQISYLCADFKKKNGYRRSIELSREYDLYRQDYCGCIYSKQERLEYIKMRDLVETK